MTESVIEQYMESRDVDALLDEAVTKTLSSKTDLSLTGQNEIDFAQQTQQIEDQQDMLSGLVSMLEGESQMAMNLAADIRQKSEARSKATNPVRKRASRMTS